MIVEVSHRQILQSRQQQLIRAQYANAADKGIACKCSWYKDKSNTHTFIITIAPLQLFGQDGLAQTHQAAGSIVVCHMQHCYYMLWGCARIYLIIVQVM